MAFFKEKDVVCCLGDSITAAGLWMAEIYQEVKKTRDVKFYNCGVSGGCAYLAADYLYQSCLSKNPTKTFVTFGVNDITRWVLSKDSTDPDPMGTVRESIERYKEKMEEIVRNIIAFGSEVILCTAMPYDEYSLLDTENLKCEFAMAECAEFVRELAKKYGTNLVDLREEFLKHMGKPDVINTDRVHPTPHGHHMMAQYILYSLGEIDAPNYEGDFIPEEWNKERMAAEGKLKLIDYIEFVNLWRFSKENGCGVIGKIEEAKKRLAAWPHENDYTAKCYKAYIADADKRILFENEIVRLTV